MCRLCLYEPHSTQYRRKTNIIVVGIIWVGIYLNYLLGNTTNHAFDVMPDLARVFYLEAGTAMVLYWYATFVQNNI